MKKILVGLLVSGALISGWAYDANAWHYYTDKDNLTDEEYSYTNAITCDYQYNNDFSIGFFCQDGNIKFIISADKLIENKDKPFTFIYRVDKKPYQKIMMRTYTNDNQGGYTYTDAKKVAKDILGGNSIFVRAITWNNDYLETTIKLKDSDKNIKRVFADCGVSLTNSAKVIVKDNYTFEQFRKDFEKLSVKKQKKLLKKLKDFINKL